jgi:hypothetical protein
MLGAADTLVMETPPTERRVADRRRRATPMISWYTFVRGRRVGDRRGSSDGQYVDRYSPRLTAALVAIGVLCAVDAVFTLLYIQRDGKEANPVMRALIQSSAPTTFVLLKCVITNVGLAVLCLHKNFKYVKPMIATLLFIYAALFLYHIYLAAAVA